MDHSTRSSLRGLDLQAHLSGSDLLKDQPSYHQPGIIYADKEKYEPTLDPAVNLLINTQLCARFVSKGYCNKTDCTFAHNEEELRPLPDLRRTKWCRLVFHGLVCHDAHCPYAHTKEQLKTNAQDLVSYKTSYCKYYQKGNCLSGGNCRFAHSPLEIRAPIDHPRCLQVREHLKIRNRDIHLRRQQARKERQALVNIQDEDGGTLQVAACPPSPSGGSLPPSGGNSPNREANEASALLKPFVHRARSSLDSNMSAAYLHARQRARIEQEQRIKQVVNSLSRASTRECVHATGERTILGKNNESTS